MDNQQGPTVCIAQGTLINVMSQPGWEGSLGENGYVCVCTADSLYCPPETSTALLTGYVLLPRCFSRVGLFVALWTVAHQAPLSMGFSRQEDWSGLPCPPPGELPEPGIQTVSTALQVDS